MALILCPECKSQVSDKAKSCPNCGCPIAEAKEEVDANKNQVNEEELICPESFPSNLMIGKYVNSGWGNHVEGIFNQQENTIDLLQSGKVDIFVHTHGIKVSEKGLSNFGEIDIHNSQIISIVKTSSADLVQSNKVIGRAVVGGLIMGPVGALIGGLSGVGREKLQVKQYLVINYWDIPTKKAKSILIQCDDKQPVLGLIQLQKKQNEENLKKGRSAEKDEFPVVNCLMLVILAIVIIFVVIVFIVTA